MRTWTALKQACISILSNSIPEGSFVHALIKVPFEDKDLAGIMDVLVEYFQGQHWHVVLAIATNYVNILEDMSSQSALVLRDRLEKLFINFTDVMNVTTKKDRLEKEETFNIRLLLAYKIWDMIVSFVKMSHTSIEKEMVKKFITSEFLENNRPPITCSIREIWANFRAQAATMPAMATQVKTGANLVSDKSINSLEAALKESRRDLCEANRKRKAAEMLATEATGGGSRGGGGGGRNGRGGGGGRGRGGGDRDSHAKCGRCGRFHAKDKCFQDPNMSDETRALKVVYEARVGARTAANVNVITINGVVDTQPAVSPELAGMVTIGVNSASESGNVSSIIILDGGSDSMLFNRFHNYLLHRVESYSCNLTGIGGLALQTVTARGEVIFMGTVIPNALYSANVSKSVVSEAVLCSLFNFKVVKEGSSCIITNKRNNTTATLNLVPGGKLQYVIPLELFEHDEECHAINLASVRPSNPKTLWHGRFGHAYMGLIVKMAKQDLYRDRGLKLPEALLKKDHDDDLCEACALGKPTFSYAYVPQHRSLVKGKLWYFDVSGGGDVAPSLIYKNRYKCLFVDSCTRMYFVYYTKNVDDKTIINVLRIFETEVLTTVTKDFDDIRFIQSDNGQLDTNGVKTWCRQRNIYARFTSAYHPNMNGLVERAFGSTDALTRCMLEAAGLPDPYWEKASNHAVLIRNIMPNQSIDGYVREAYFLWYGLTYNYSRLRTWGCRAYAMNHITKKDYGNRSVAGIFVGMKPQNPLTYDYEIYLPAKDVFVTSGDVIFCEHVGRSEPERLLPPLSTLSDISVPLEVNDYQYLVDTVHMDNEEGVRYKVLKVYKFRGLACVDRILYDPDDPNAVGGMIDTVHLLDVLGYPILLGKQNMRYQPVPAVEQAREVINRRVVETPLDSSVTRDASSASPAQLRVAGKRLLLQASQAEQSGNAAAGVRRRSKRGKVSISSTEVTTVLPYEDTISKSILDWAVGNIPDELWLPVEPHEGREIDTVSAYASASSFDGSLYENPPRHHGEAMSRASERVQWIASEKRETDALNELHFADIVDIPEGRTLLPVIWVYAYKTDEKGNRVLYKSRLVVRGDMAKPGFDYFETYSPVAKIESIRLVLALIISHRLRPLQLDVSNAYVQSLIEEDVYIKAIPGVFLPPGKCYKLLCSLYGMPQAGRNWNSLVSSFLITLGFVSLREDLCVFVLFVEGILVIVIALYVDDFVAGFDTEAREKWFVDTLLARFKAKVIGLPSNVLGLSVKWEPIEGQGYFKSVHIANIKTVNILEIRFDLVGAKPTNLPYNLAATLSKLQCPSGTQLECPEVKQMQTEYRTLVGTFIWLLTTTRVDIIQTVLILSQFFANPSYQHYIAALWLVKYLKGTKELGISYRLDADNTLAGYADADHASHESRRSIYSYLFMFAGGPLFWKNGFEARFSLSTAESEIRAVFALREAIKHVLYMKKVFISLLKVDTANSATIAMSSLPTAVFEDNLATIRYSMNPTSQSTMKYLEVDILWIHDAIARGEFKLVSISTVDQLADIGTKFNRADIFLKLRKELMC